MIKKNVLIVCDDNTSLSKIAEAHFKKQGSYWKNFQSAGINTFGKQINVIVPDLLKQNGLEHFIDLTIRNIDEFTPESIDYIIALTANAFDSCKEKFQNKEIILLTLDGATADIAVLSEIIRRESLNFIRSGPLKRWLNQ